LAISFNDEFHRKTQYFMFLCRRLLKLRLKNSLFMETVPFW
jgi:hypothetical protein